MTTLAMNLYNQAVTQYTKFDYNSLAVFNNTPIGLSNSGIQKLEQDSHDGDTINAYFVTPYTDLGDTRQKRIRTMLIGGQTDDTIQITVECDENDSNSYTVEFSQDSFKLSGSKQSGKRSQKGCFFQFKIANFGNNFSINSFEVDYIALASKPDGV